MVAKVEPLTPHPESDRLRLALEKCRRHLAPWAGVMYRATGTEYANRGDLLSGVGAKLHGGRWTPRGAFNAVYGSLEPQSAGREALTQTVVRLALEINIQALLVPSARLKGAKNLVIFPDTLRRGALKTQNVEKLPEPQ